MEKLSRFISYHSKKILVIALVLLIPAVMGSLATRINYDILSYLPEDLDSSKGMEYLEDVFQNAATNMLIVEDMPPKYTQDLKAEIEKIDGIKSITWIDDFMDISFPSQMLPKKAGDIFYSADSGATMMIIQYKYPGASDETRNAINEIYKICNKQCFLAGVSVVTDDIAKLVEHELPIYVILAVLMSLAALFVVIDSWALPFIYLAGIGIAVIYNLGTNYFLGEISYITKAIAAVLQLGVSMDYSVFLVNRYKEERGNYTDKRDAMAQAIKAAFSSLFGSSMTTVAGFLALCAMRLTLGKDIGIVMAKGVILGVLVVLFVLPSLILIFDNQIMNKVHKVRLPNFSKITDFTISRSKSFTFLFLILFIPTFIMQGKVRMYYDLIRALPSEMPSIVANDKLADEFNMATTQFIVVSDEIPGAKLEEMEKKIENVKGVSNLVAYNNLLGSTIPEEFVPDKIKEACKSGGKQMIMVNGIYETATDEANNQVDEINAILKSYDPNAVMTGQSPLTKDLIETAAVDFNVTNLISIAAILVIIGLLFKSLTVPIILVASIELAIFLNMSVSYLTGVVIPFVSPTVIGCIQLGATVDYAILITTRFKEELENGQSREMAMRIAGEASIHSIITSSLVLFCATFGVGMVSKVEIIGSLCTMLSRGSLISAVVSIFVLPSVLYLSEPLIRRTTASWPNSSKVSLKKKLAKNN